MRQETLKYTCGETLCKGHLVFDDQITSRRPAVLIAHAWRGLDGFAKDKALELAALGYVAFAVDLYGEGKEVKTDEEAKALMIPLFINRQLLRDRLSAAFETVTKLNHVDKTRIGAIGFCFGGLAVIELLRNGVDVRGVVSFHGVLGNTLEDKRAHLAPPVEPIKGSLLILHGHQDPMVSKEDIAAIQTEFTQLGVDWQMHIYGHAAHAFTNPEASNEKRGLVYNELANKRSWQAMCNFFEELF